MSYPVASKAKAVGDLPMFVFCIGALPTWRACLELLTQLAVATGTKIPRLAVHNYLGWALLL